MFSYARLIVAGIIASLFGTLLLYSYAQNKQLKAARLAYANVTVQLETKETECRNKATAYNAIGAIKQIEGSYRETNTTTDDNATVIIDLDSLWDN